MPMGAIHRLGLDMAWIFIQHGCVASSARTPGIEVFIRSPPAETAEISVRPEVNRVR